jgi:hypothetical protein
MLKQPLFSPGESRICIIRVSQALLNMQLKCDDLIGPELGIFCDVGGE